MDWPQTIESLQKLIPEGQPAIWMEWEPGQEPRLVEELNLLMPDPDPADTAALHLMASRGIAISGEDSRQIRVGGGVRLVLGSDSTLPETDLWDRLESRESPGQPVLFAVCWR